MRGNLPERSIKDCECGKQAKTADSFALQGSWRRRYHCACGRRWSTLEVMADSKAGRLTRTEGESAERRRVAFELNEIIAATLQEWAQK